LNIYIYSCTTFDPSAMEGTQHPKGRGFCLHKNTRTHRHTS
jgi:hypothetical protein